MAVDLHIDPLKRCVSNTIYDDDLDLMRGSFQRDANTGLLSSVAGAPADAAMKHVGGIWPSRAHTMIGGPRLDNRRHCVETVIH
ncbi:MAG: hypothetical protein HOI95_06635 [Chromatiales bacterium]|jgi:hypothetical protein|nr:hypothetical protein [Chromatiales bacterium]